MDDMSTPFAANVALDDATDSLIGSNMELIPVGFTELGTVLGG